MKCFYNVLKGSDTLLMNVQRVMADIWLQLLQALRRFIGCLRSGWWASLQLYWHVSLLPLSPRADVFWQLYFCIPGQHEAPATKEEKIFTRMERVSKLKSSKRCCTTFLGQRTDPIICFAPFGLMGGTRCRRLTLDWLVFIKLPVEILFAHTWLVNCNTLSFSLKQAEVDKELKACRWKSSF